MLGRRILTIYHFYHPDKVVSAQLFTELSENLAQQGWEVTALTSNRLHHCRTTQLSPSKETRNGVTIFRRYRPPFNQSKHFGRLLNTSWLMLTWSAFLARQKNYDAIILGTDPQFGYLIAPWIRLISPRTKIITWAFDLYPEIIIEKRMGVLSTLAKLTTPIARCCYRQMHGLVDIGECMRSRLKAYSTKAKQATLTPWARLEPAVPQSPHPQTRKELFGEARLTLFYSGTLGQAHTYQNFLSLARLLRQSKASVAFCFAGRGSGYEALQQELTEEDTNVSMADFTDEATLEARLASADIHLISLREGLEGLVLPSKFFAALAFGKPVLYTGTPYSSIKKHIDEQQIGFYLDAQNMQATADQLTALAEDPKALEAISQRAFSLYQNHFSKAAVTEGWNRYLQELLG